MAGAAAGGPPPVSDTLPPGADSPRPYRPPPPPPPQARQQLYWYLPTLLRVPTPPRRGSLLRLGRCKQHICSYSYSNWFIVLL